MAVLRDKEFESSKCQIQLHVHNTAVHADNHDNASHVDVVISFNVGYETLKQVKITCNYDGFAKAIRTLNSTVSAMLESSSMADI